MAFAPRPRDRLRISQDTRPPSASPARTTLLAAYFDRNESHVSSGQETRGKKVHMKVHVT
jgi:hypothetical protein